MTIKERLELAKDSKTELGAIYTLISGEVSSDADLSALVSSSKTAMYKLWMYIFSFISWVQEELWGDAKAELQAIADQGIPGTDKWLANEIVNFQYGDTLVFDTDTAAYSYAVVDEAKQIVFRKAVTSQNGLTLIKVAKDDGTGVPIALSSAELTAFQDYVDEIRWAGSNLKAVSVASDKLWIPAAIYYDALVTQTVVQANVEAAIEAYLGNLPFNGEFALIKLVDAIQAATGVIDVVLGTVQARPDGSSFGVVSRVYSPNSGYFEIDSSYPLSTTLTYTAG